MGPRRRWPWCWAMLLVLILLAGCTREQPRVLADLSLRATTPIEAMVRHVTPSWAVPFRPASRPAVTEQAVLAYESARDGQFDLVALDLADGRELWRRPASLGAVADGIEPRLTTGKVGGRELVAYLSGDPGGQTLLLADPRTGEAAYQLPLGTGGNLGSCRVIGGICVEKIEGGRRTLLRVDPDRGTLAPLQLPGGPVDQVRPLGNGGYLVRRGGATMVGMTGELGQWEKPVSDWLGTDVDPARSWLEITVDEESTQLQVTARPLPLGTPGSAFGVGEVTQAAVNLVDGELLWSKEGRSWVCPGGVALACTGDKLGFTRSPSGAVRPGGAGVTYLAADAGGEELWRREVANPGPPTSGRLPVRAPAATPVLASNGRLIALDPESGEQTTLGDEHWLACDQVRTFRARQRSDPARPMVDFRVTTSIPCNATGRSAAEPAQFTIAGILAVAATRPLNDRDPTIPGHYAVALPEQLALYR
ncbi:hypothetical protein [Enemella evansiae]|uniref:hypothetical protein n=1 Tax=Enemella evansiae TaxID=2016499 RepID=UPI00117E7A67|nr:hypothetical protein [Enemella evansiae]